MNSPISISKVEKLTALLDVRNFKCGQNSLDHFLRRYALKNRLDDLSQTYVVHRQSVVLGYYTLVYSTVSLADAAPSIVEGITSSNPVPVMLLARWAVDKREQGQGLGQALLKDAFLRTQQAAEIGGLRAMLVDAIDDRMALFCEKMGFSRCPVGARKLMISIDDIRAGLAPQE